MHFSSEIALKVGDFLRDYDESLGNVDHMLL